MPCFSCFIKISYIKTPNTPFEYEVVVPNQKIIWGMVFLPDGSMLLTQKNGKLYHVTNGNKQEFKDLLHYWVPSISLSGMAFITSEKYPNLKGDLLVGSLKFQYLEHLILDGKKITGRKHWQITRCGSRSRWFY